MCCNIQYNGFFFLYIIKIFKLYNFIMRNRKLLAITLLVYLVCTVFVTSKIDPFERIYKRLPGGQYRLIGNSSNSGNSGNSGSNGNSGSGGNSGSSGSSRSNRGPVSSPNPGQLNFNVVNYDQVLREQGQSRIISNLDSPSMWAYIAK